MRLVVIKALKICIKLVRKGLSHSSSNGAYAKNYCIRAVFLCINNVHPIFGWTLLSKQKSNKSLKIKNK